MVSMVFRSRRFQRAMVINSTKNIAENSAIMAATTNTLLDTPVNAVQDAVQSVDSQVERNCKITSMYVSLFFITEGGELANEVPLVDWYIIKDQGGRMGAAGFIADGLPTPGSTGSHENKRYIFHTEKGLAGGGNVSLNGVPMIFKGVIKIPKGFQHFKLGDQMHLVSRANFNTKFCTQCIYKWYQ